MRTGPSSIAELLRERHDVEENCESLSHFQDQFLTKPMTLSITLEFRYDAEMQMLHPDALIRLLSKRKA